MLNPASSCPWKGARAGHGVKEEVVIYGQKYRERKQTVVLISDAGFVIVREAKKPLFSP